MVTIRQKRTENLKLVNSLSFKKTINFKVMKTIGNQLKDPIGLQLQFLLKNGIKNSWYSIFYAVTKRTKNRQQTKTQLKPARKCFGSSKAILWPPKYVQFHLRQTPIMHYVADH